MRKALLLSGLALALHGSALAQSPTVDDSCSTIQKKIDEFEGTVRLNSPMSVGYRLAPMIIYKDVEKGKAIYTLSLRTIGHSVTVDGKGAIILFTDGTKITKPVEIDVDADESGFEYSAYITLTATDLDSLSKKKVKKFRLYIYDEDVEEGFSTAFAANVACIRKQK